MKVEVEIGINSPYTRVKVNVDLPDNINAEDEDAVGEYLQSIEDTLREKAGKKCEAYIDAIQAAGIQGHDDVDISLYMIYKDIYEFGEIEDFYIEEEEE